MKISILTPNLSGNCFGRAYLLAEMLQGYYDVEIVGPIYGDGIWRVMIVNEKIKIKGIRGSRISFLLHTNNVLKNISGEVIFASKPLIESFSMGLLKKIINKKPLIIDVDDWELGIAMDSYREAAGSEKIKLIANPINFSNLYFLSTFLSEKLIRFADEVTVSSRCLQKKFGGTIIWHARDEEFFNPDKYDKLAVREKYGVNASKNVVMFLGSPKQHKGLEDLIKAINYVEKATLVIIGLDKKDKYSLYIDTLAKRILGERYTGFEIQPFQKAPEFIAMADVMVIPQKKTSTALWQVPAKIFDAMAMAKPIIATSVCDIPEILNKCGWIIEPDNTKQLSEAINYVLTHPDEQKKMGTKARKKFVEKYSKKVVEKVLIGVFKQYTY